MIKLPRVMVLANGTHISLALALRKSGLFSSVESAELYSMPPEKLTTLADHLNEYDFILTIEHGMSFGPLATNTLRQNHGTKVVTLPTPFFSGLMPDMAYVKYRDELARAGSILGDYHSALILAEAKAGLSEGDVVERYVSGQAFERLDIQGVWEDSLTELRSREAETDITLSGFIERRTLEGSIINDFLSFNHPTEHLINHIADSFACLTLDKSTLDRPLLAAEHNLYLDAYWPIHPKVSETLGLPINPNQKFKAPNRLGGRILSRAEFARASFYFFTEGGVCQEYHPVTPVFLSPRIKQGPLTLTPKKTTCTEGKEVIMTHLGRSGSTVVAMMLAQHPDIHWLEEYFTLLKYHSHTTYNYTCPKMLEMIVAKVAEAKAIKPEIIVGYEIKPINFLENPSCDLIDYMYELRDPTRYMHIVLRRRNILRRIFSVYKAMQTNIFHVSASDTQQIKRRYTVNMDNLVDFDTGQCAATLPELIEKARQYENEMLDSYRKLGIDFLELVYEDDVENDPNVAYRKILEYINVDFRPAQISFGKTGGELADEVENYEMVAAALKGSQDEWMLTASNHRQSRWLELVNRSKRYVEQILCPPSRGRLSE